MKRNHSLLYLVVLFISCGKGDSNGSGGGGIVTPPPVTATTFTNPLLSTGPDPWVIQQDSTYYYMHTLGDRLSIYSTQKMSQLSKSTVTTIWTPPTSGLYSKNIWAPELHRFNNKWFMYFAADDGNNANHRIYVLENDAVNPLSGNWVFKGKLTDPDNDNWAIDASAFQYNNQLYLIWSGWQGAVDGEQDIYIAKLSDPLTMQGHRVLIASPTQSWEKNGAPPIINEGPEALISPSGQLFLTFSASACWSDNYCLGLLTLKPGSDPLVPSNWSKSPNPAFSLSADNGAYGPGHNSFFTSKDGTQSWILYHANSTINQGCGNARNPRIQQFTWNADGTPNFGTPARINTAMNVPAGE